MGVQRSPHAHGGDGCPLVIVQCSCHPGYGPGLEDFLEKTLGFYDLPCDVISIPRGFRHLLDRGTRASMHLISELKLAIGLHGLEVAVLIDHPDCICTWNQEQRFHGNDALRAAQEMQRLFSPHEYKDFKVFTYTVAEEVPKPSNDLLIACLDNRESLLTLRRTTNLTARLLGHSQPCAVLTSAGDHDRFREESCSITADLMAEFAEHAVDPTKLGVVMLMAHFDCGWRKKVWEFGSSTPKSEQALAFTKAAEAAERALRHRLPNHTFRRMTALTEHPVRPTNLVSLLDESRVVEVESVPSTPTPSLIITPSTPSPSARVRG